MQILYIEDNIDDAKLVERYVATTHHQLTIVPTFDAALNMIGHTPPDLILLDILLHRERTGFDLARRLRATGFDAPIVAVTALTTPDDIQASKQAGVDFILAKPFSIAQLADVLRSYS